MYMYRLGHQSPCKVQNIVNYLNFGREECSYPNPHHRTMITHLRSVSEHTVFCCATKAKGTVFVLMLFCKLTPSCICNMSMDTFFMTNVCVQYIVAAALYMSKMVLVYIFKTALPTIHTENTDIALRFLAH